MNAINDAVADLLCSPIGELSLLPNTPRARTGRIRFLLKKGGMRTPKVMKSRMRNLSHGEEVLHGVVPKVERDFTKTQQVHVQALKLVQTGHISGILERVLDKKAGNHAHGGRKRRSADVCPLDALFIDSTGNK